MDVHPGGSVEANAQVVHDMHPSDGRICPHVPWTVSLEERGAPLVACARRGEGARGDEPPVLAKRLYFNVVQPPRLRSRSNMSEDRNKLLQFEGWCGKPGDLWDKFDIRLMNGSTKTDERGNSLADHLMGVDENGPNGPAYPGENTIP